MNKSATDHERAVRHVAEGFEFHQAGDMEAAQRCYRSALALQPEHGDANYLLGLVEMGHGQFDRAREHFLSAVRTDSSNAFYRFGEGEVARELNDRDGAIRAFEAGLAVDGSDAARWAQLGDLKLAAGRPSEAECCAAKALELDAGFANGWHLLGESLRFQARSAEAAECFRKAMMLEKGYGPAAESLLMALNYSDRIAPTEVAAEHRRIGGTLAPWGASGEPSAPRTVDQAAREGKRPLRVGYVSADFGPHVVSFFIGPVIAAHDRRKVETFCYFAGSDKDPRSIRIKEDAAHSRSIAGLDDRAAVDLIRADALDVAVDLSGHTRGQRLGIFGHRVAPVQVTWIGYPNTTGVPTIDFRLTDAWCDPPGTTEALHTETLWRLESGFIAFQPLPDAPPVAALPSRQTGRVTFGSFNNPAKITDTCLKTWAKLLARCPNASILLKGKGLDEPVLAAALRRRFGAVGGDPSLLALDGGKASHFDHLGAYNSVDVALDTFPYHGTTTTCEALTMGVPVVTLAGATHVSRVGVSLLTRAGCAQWIAESPQRYVEIACALATDTASLGHIRADLRWQLSQSALGDVARVARSVEEAYLGMVRRGSRAG